MKKISVIIPTYKTGNYIYQCIDSIENQTLPKNDFEVLIILNGVKEPYYSNIKKYLITKNIDSRLIYTEICGVSNARNIGLDNANGENICFIDDDDWVSPNYLHKLYTCIKPDCISICNIVNYYEISSSFAVSNYSKGLKFNKKVPLIKNRSYLSNCWAKMIPRRMIDFRRFNTAFQNSEDALFMFTISDRLKYFNVADSKSSYYRRIRKNSLSRAFSVWNLIINSFKFIVSIITIYFRNLRDYRFLLFLTRLIAPFKYIYHTICLNEFIYDKTSSCCKNNFR